MENKHTPGPWEIEVTERNSWDSEKNKPAQSYWLDLKGPDGKSFPHGVYGSEWPKEKQDLAKANAQLISAAPDLLAGAEDLFEKLPEAAMLGAKLRIAIAKARGK